MTYTLESKGGALTASVQIEKRVAPRAVLLRLRHPQGKRILRVKLPAGDRYTVVVRY